VQNGNFVKRPYERPEFERRAIRAHDADVYIGDVYARSPGEPQRFGASEQDESAAEGRDDGQNRGNYAYTDSEGGVQVDDDNDEHDYDVKGRVNDDDDNNNNDQRVKVSDGPQEPPQESREGEWNEGDATSDRDSLEPDVAEQQSNEEAGSESDSQTEEGYAGAAPSGAVSEQAGGGSVQTNGGVPGRLREVSQRLIREEGEYASLEDKLTAIHERLVSCLRALVVTIY
jgi:hypothetical protein